LGAFGIGEQKFELNCDARAIERIASMAADYQVPILMHIQHRAYNTSLERFHKVLENIHERISSGMRKPGGDISIVIISPTSCIQQVRLPLGV